jgi:hypothetical protein
MQFLVDAGIMARVRIDGVKTHGGFIVNDEAYVLSMKGGVGPSVMFAAGDYLDYDRASKTLKLLVGNTTLLSWYDSAGDGSGNPRMMFSSGAYLEYNLGTPALSLMFGAVESFNAQASGLRAPYIYAAQTDVSLFSAIQALGSAASGATVGKAAFYGVGGSSALAAMSAGLGGYLQGGVSSNTGPGGNGATVYGGNNTSTGLAGKGGLFIGGDATVSGGTPGVGLEVYGGSGGASNKGAIGLVVYSGSGATVADAALKVDSVSGGGNGLVVTAGYTGIVATAGSTAIGIKGTGNPGVEGEGKASGDIGVQGIGNGAGYGVRGVSVGSSAVAGVLGVGGVSSSNAPTYATARAGVYALADDAYNGLVVENTGSRAPMHFVSKTTAEVTVAVEGDVYYDSTLHKLRVRGQAGWETITSV